MRFVLPTLFLASPALAHPANLPHTHAADWAVPVALLLTGVAVFAARRRAMRIKARK